LRMLAVEEEPEVAEETGEDTEEPERIGRVRKDEEGAEKP